MLPNETTVFYKYQMSADLWPFIQGNSFGLPHTFLNIFPSEITGLFDGVFIIGITHVFSCINICRVPRMLFEHEADRPSVQHHPRDPASVNAMIQTCVIVILAYLPYSSPIRTENAAKT